DLAGRRPAALCATRAECADAGPRPDRAGDGAGGGRANRRRAAARRAAPESRRRSRLARRGAAPRGGPTREGRPPVHQKRPPPPHCRVATPAAAWLAPARSTLGGTGPTPGPAPPPRRHSKRRLRGVLLPPPSTPGPGAPETP